MEFRAYDPSRDQEAVRRIWRETGWLGTEGEEAMDLLVEAGRALVADLDGEPECLVTSCPGTIRYLREDVPLSCVTGVTTSHVARRQGFAGRLTAATLAADVADGAIVSSLGMFEQGYYNRLGFGTLGYDHWVAFGPSELLVDHPARPPRRLSAEDFGLIHGSRLARHRGHGACSLTPPAVTRNAMVRVHSGFGLGYCDGPNGELTHHLWVRDDGEHGPYYVRWLAYQSPEQFLELMALLKSLGDQVYAMKTVEPAGIQLQDLIERPFFHRRLSENSEYQHGITSAAWCQMRVCDLPGCLERTRLRGDEVRFNLSLSDPIETKLASDAPWRGVAGDYVVTLGPSSGAEPGTDTSLLALTASVNAFTRLWLGVRPATGLAVTDDLSGPPELLDELDWLLRLPDPKPDWSF